MKAVARTIVHGAPLARRCCSAAYFAWKSPTALSGDAPTMERSTTPAPAAAAASMRWTLPSRSTEAGLTPPGPSKPWTAETTVVVAAHRRREGGGVANVADDDLRRAGQVARAGRVAGEHADLVTAAGQPAHDQGTQPPGATGDEDHARATWASTASSTVPAVSSTGSR